jgi:hypothetical protein
MEPPNVYGLSDHLRLPPAFSISADDIRLPYLKQTYGIPPKSILPSISRFSHSSSSYTTIITLGEIRESCVLCGQPTVPSTGVKIKMAVTPANFIFVHMSNNHCHRVTTQLQLIIVITQLRSSHR